MSAYKTAYEKYTKSQVTALFSSDTWKSLSLSQRLDACQEIENRHAAENNTEPCLITHQPIDGASYGWQNGNTICLNTFLIQDGEFCTTFMDADGRTQTVRTAVPAAGWNTLDTIYHEGTHGIQEHTGRMPSVYISPEMDYDLYRIQGIEKEAYAAGQMKTLESLSDYEKAVNHLDSQRSEYIASVRADSFQAALLDASQNYNDADIEQTLQTVINDRENGIQRTDASRSYQAINDLCDSYGVYSAAVLSDLPENTLRDLQTSPETSQIELSQEMSGFLNEPPEIPLEYDPDDGMTEPEELWKPVVSINDYSAEDGSEEPSFHGYPGESMMNDGMSESQSGSSCTIGDDGFSGFSPSADYGGTAQFSSYDGSQDFSGAVAGSYSGPDSYASGGADYSE